MHHNHKFSSLERALGRRNGVAVLAVLFTISEEDNDALLPVLNSISRIVTAGERSSLF